MSASIECGYCKGSGRRPLGRPLASALAAVGVEWLTTYEIVAVHNEDADAKLEKVSATTMLARLDRLYALGLIERQQPNLRTYEWRRVP